MKRTIKQKKKVRTSARLRQTEKVAKLAGFKYDSKTYPNGGFLSCWELEQIADKLDNV